MSHTPGTQAGVSETIIEMAAEMIDPAMWAAIQLTKPDQPPAKTVGEVRDRIAVLLRQAIDMTRAAELARLRAELEEARGIVSNLINDLDDANGAIARLLPGSESEWGINNIEDDQKHAREAARAFLAKHGGGG